MPYSNLQTNRITDQFGKTIYTFAQLEENAKYTLISPKKTKTMVRVLVVVNTPQEAETVNGLILLYHCRPPAPNQRMEWVCMLEKVFQCPKTELMERFVGFEIDTFRGGIEEVIPTKQRFEVQMAEQLKLWNSARDTIMSGRDNGFLPEGVFFSFAPPQLNTDKENCDCDICDCDDTDMFEEETENGTVGWTFRTSEGMEGEVVFEGRQTPRTKRLTFNWQWSYLILFPSIAIDIKNREIDLDWIGGSISLYLGKLQPSATHKTSLTQKIINSLPIAAKFWQELKQNWNGKSKKTDYTP